MYPLQRILPGLLSAANGLLTAATVLLLTALASGGGLDPILGTPAVTRVPTDTLTLPLAAAAASVDLLTLMPATFSKPMAASTLTASSFTRACPAATPVAPKVSYATAAQQATLTTSAPLSPGPVCVATVSTAAQDSTAVPLASAFS